MHPALSGPSSVLLAHSYYLRYDPKQVKKMRPYPPLATLITAAVLREAGFEVRLFDAMLAGGVEEFHDMLNDVRPAIVGILEDNFNFLTKMCTVRMREAALQMVRAARDAGAMVAVNGADASDHALLYLEAGAHAVIIGEVEPTFLELAQAWLRDAEGSLDGIAGLLLPPHDAMTPTNGVVVRRTGQRPPLERLDDLPFPAWDLVDAAGYRAAWTGAHGRLSWNMVASRGCPYRCNWCAKPIFGNRYTQRTAAGVAEELRRLRDAIAPDHVWFADDIFGLTPQWIERFAREVAVRDAATPFMMQSRVNLMAPRVVDALARSSAEEVWLGVESGSQRVLDAMDKGSKVSQIRSATRTLREFGIRCGWFVQLGYLGETWDDILLTRDLVRAERPDDIGVSVSYPLPGTRFYENVRAHIGAKSNWTDSDDLEMMFAGSYSTPFYRTVRDLLHAEVKRPRDVTARALDAQWAEVAAREPAERRAGRRSLPVS